MRASFHPQLRAAYHDEEAQLRTRSAWTPGLQDDLSRLRVGVIGCGSVGAIVAESLARTGVLDISLLDFDTVEVKNLDRLLHSSYRDAKLRRSKVEVLRRALQRSRSSRKTCIRAFDLSVAEPEGFSAALDQDVIFCCVDRPWARYVLNVIAYAHHIPVIDGGVAVDSTPTGIRSADWRAHVVGVERRCLECLHQYEPAAVALERTGLLEDPSYIRDGGYAIQRLVAGENVFAFSNAAASSMMLQFLRSFIAPGGQADVGALHEHFTTGAVDRDERDCDATCIFPGHILGKGSQLAFQCTGEHDLARAVRNERASSNSLILKTRRAVDDLLWKLHG